jgi:hypothetical protein
MTNNGGEGSLTGGGKQLEYIPAKNINAIQLLHIVTDLIDALPGNSSVNTVQHATIDGGSFLCSPRWAAVERDYAPVSKERLGKHISSYQTCYEIGDIINNRDGVFRGVCAMLIT